MVCGGRGNEQNTKWYITELKIFKDMHVNKSRKDVGNESSCFRVMVLDGYGLCSTRVSFSAVIRHLYMPSAL